MSVLYAFVFAHFLSDFALQPDRLVERKRSRLALAHLLHGAVVLVTMLLLGWLARGELTLALALCAASVGVLHTAQDWAKDSLRSKWPRGFGWGSLLGDQVLHLAVIAVLAGAFGLAHPATVASSWLAGLKSPAIYAAATLAMLGTFVAGVLLRTALEPLVPYSAEALRPGSSADPLTIAESAAARLPTRGDAQAKSFVQTSYWVGVTERVIVIASVALAGPQGLATAGLVVAAKSIFRWRDLDADPHAVQYFLLGTLASVAVAVVDGLLLRRILA